MLLQTPLLTTSSPSSHHRKEDTTPFATSAMDISSAQRDLDRFSAMAAAAAAAAAAATSDNNKDRSKSPKAADHNGNSDAGKKTTEIGPPLNPFANFPQGAFPFHPSMLANLANPAAALNLSSQLQGRSPSPPRKATGSPPNSNGRRNSAEDEDVDEENASTTSASKIENGERSASTSPVASAVDGK